MPVASAVAAKRGPKTAVSDAEIVAGIRAVLAAFVQGVRQRAVGAEYVRAHLTGTAAQEIAG